MRVNLTMFLPGLCLVTVFGCNSSKREIEPQMDITDKQVAEKFGAFEKERQPALVQEALETIEASLKDVPFVDKSARKLGLTHWLRFFEALDRNVDAQWNPKDLPAKGVPPPSSYRGVVYPSGEVDPSLITDPAERARYLQALKDSKDNEERFNIQLQLRRIDERAMANVEKLLAETYTASADQQELEKLLGESQLTNERKERLRQLASKPGRN